MDLITFLVIVAAICLLLYVVNMTPLIPLTPPFKWGFNVIALIVFLLILLRIGGVYSFHSIRIGGG